MKSDASIRNISIAAIKRKAYTPFDFQSTRVFETGKFSDIPDLNVNLPNIHQDELPIATIFVDASNWTVITTRQIITSINGAIKNANAIAVIYPWHWGDFKGYIDKNFTMGKVHLDDADLVEIFIEVGKASMIPIYAIMTLVDQVKSLATRQTQIS